MNPDDRPVSDEVSAADQIPSPGFLAWARMIVRHRTLVVMAAVMLSALAVSSIVWFKKVDNSIEAFMGRDSEAASALDRFRDDFGRDDVFLIAIEGDVFSLGYLEKVQALHDELVALDLDLPTLGERKRDRDTAKGWLPKKAVDPGPSEGGEPDPFADAAGGDPFAGADGEDPFAEFGDDDSWGDAAGGSVIDEVTSIVSVSQTRGTEDGIEVGGLMEPMPTTQAEVDELRARVLGDKKRGYPPDDSLIGQVVSADGTHSAMMVRLHFMGDEDSERVNDAILEILGKHETESFKTHLAGVPALSAALHRMLLSDLAILFSLALLTLALTMFAMFRHPLACIGPGLVTIFAALWSFGLMFACGFTLTMLWNALPAFFICVGLADSIHLLDVYRDQRRQGVPNDEAIAVAVGVTGTPVFFTSLTTAIGLLSFRFASVDAVGEMGTTGAVGVGIAFLNTVTVLPAILTFNKKSTFGARAGGENDRVDRLLDACNGLSKAVGLGPDRYRRRNRTVAVALVLSIGALYCASHLRVWHNPLAWIPDEAPISQAFDTVDEHLGGTATVHLLVDTPRVDGVKDLELIQGLEALEEAIKAYEHPEHGGQLVGNSLSVVDVIAQTNQALMGGAPEHRKVPDTQQAVNERFVAFESAGPEELKRLMTIDGTKTHLTIRNRWQDASAYIPYAEFLDQEIERLIPAEKATVTPTGAVFSLLSSVGSLIADLMRSFGVAFVVITFLMIALLRDWKLALVAMVPNLLPIAYIMGFMGLVGIPIDMNNILIASIALGIAVDDTIHVLHHFKVHFDRSGDVDQAIHHALHHSGRAIVVTSVVLVAGFSIYLASQMVNLQRFGLLIALVVVLALFLDLICTPALLRLLYGGKQNRPDEAEPNAITQEDVPDATTPEAV